MPLIITSNFSLQFQSSARWVAHVTRGFLAHYSWSYYSSMATERSLLERISTVGGFTVFSVIYSELIGEGVWYFFLTYIFTSYPIFTKYSRPRNTREKKFWTLKIPTRKYFGPTKYPLKVFGPTTYPWEKILNPRNTHEKKFWTHKMPTSKGFGPTKYPREKKFGPTQERWHDNTRPTRPTIARDPLNLAHSFYIFRTV